MNIKFILGDSNWNFVQVGYPVDTPTDIAVVVAGCAVAAVADGVVAVVVVVVAVVVVVV